MGIAKGMALSMGVSLTEGTGKEQNGQMEVKLPAERMKMPLGHRKKFMPQYIE